MHLNFHDYVLLVDDHIVRLVPELLLIFLQHPYDLLAACDALLLVWLPLHPLWLCHADQYRRVQQPDTVRRVPELRHQIVGVLLRHVERKLLFCLEAGVDLVFSNVLLVDPPPELLAHLAH